jgi:hypothetical protein
VWLPDELVHFCVRSEVDDEIDFWVLDSVDSTAEGRVVTGEILEQVAELVRPRVLPLVDTENLVPVVL